MMRIHVKIVGALAKPLGKDAFDLELPAGARVEELLLAVGYEGAHLRFIIPVVNGVHERLSHALTDGDEVRLFLPTSGG